MNAYVDLLTNWNFWRLALEVFVVIPLLTGPEFGIVRWTEWLKLTFGFKDKFVGVGPVKIPVAQLVAAVLCLPIATIVSFVEGAFDTITPTPTVVVAVALALFQLTQAWFRRLHTN